MVGLRENGVVSRFGPLPSRVVPLDLWMDNGDRWYRIPAKEGGTCRRERNQGIPEMAHIVTGRCVDCRYTDCCTVCPVDCFYETTDPPMLVIDPDTCIDCELCVPECPINAIYPESELPAPYAEWTQKNAELFKLGVNISEKKDALPGALPLDQIQEKEKLAGFSIDEPSKAG